MKIAYLLGSLNRGGTETLILDILNNTALFNIICIYRKEGSLSKLYHSTSINIYRLTPCWGFSSFKYVIRLRKLAKTNMIEIIHTHQSIDTIYAFFACFSSNTKIVQTTHEFDFSYSIFEKILKRISFLCADLNLFVSKTLFDHYKLGFYLPKRGTSILYDAVDFSKFSNNKSISIRSTLKIAKDIPILGMVGNFGVGHDQATVCRFLDILNKQNISFVFLFIGAKEKKYPYLFENCVDYCNNNGLNNKVIFLGSRPDVPELLFQLDSFIYATNHDAFGISVIEAIAAGIPVFVNNWEVIKEISENGKRVNLYRSKDEIDLYNKFIQYYRNPESYRENAKKNAIWAMNTFSITKHIAKLNNLYLQIIN